ncbi:hypothetical protein [Microbacterium atlanticum]|uniref:hypothetical protein n=1 Tax=Microbacterium atlanticum TaxID=2782168 RepID=UPI00188828D0|nr:hypothetical protein [Microbacterium atlanticum]
MSDGLGREAPVSIPSVVRVRLARPAVQLIADEVGADILHIKGDAVDTSLRAVAQPGTDVDALVRPSQVASLDRGLKAHGWQVYSTFRYGSPFGHAQTYLHPTWGYFDLHRSFPGVRRDAEQAFELLWRERKRLEMPGARGSAPAREAQAVLLVLNDARNRARVPDPVNRWIDGGRVDADAVSAWVDRLEARVGFAAATGDLERYRGEPDYPLWRVTTQGGTRVAEWRARIRAAPTFAEAIRIAALAPVVNVEQLAHRLGRSPTRREIVAGFLARPLTAIRQLPRRRTGGGTR